MGLLCLQIVFAHLGLLHMSHCGVVRGKSALHTTCMASIVLELNILCLKAEGAGDPSLKAQRTTRRMMTLPLALFAALCTGLSAASLASAGVLDGSNGTSSSRIIVQNALVLWLHHPCQLCV